MFKLISNQKGVSLIEVMVAAGISGIIALGTMKINENSQRGMRKVSTDFAVNNLVNMQLRNYLGDGEVCASAFGGTYSNPGSKTFNKIQVTLPNASGGGSTTKVLLEKDQKLEGELKVTSITLQRHSQSACELELRFAREGKHLGPKDVLKRLDMGCAFDTSNVLMSCSATGGSEGHWEPQDLSGYLWLENTYGTLGQIVLGAHSGSVPYSRIYVKPINANNVWRTNSGTPVYDGMGFDQNYVIRWAAPTSTSTGYQKQGSGVGLFGSGECINFQRATDGSPFFESCKNGATIEGTTTSGGKLTVEADGAEITGDTLVKGNIDLDGKTVLSGSSDGNDHLAVSNSVTIGNNIHGTHGSFKTLNVFGTGTSLTTTGSIKSGGSIEANSFMYTSDERLKRNIESLDEKSLSKVQALRPVTFNWEDTETRGHQTEHGFIAQEVQSVYPDAVVTSDDGYLSVKYGGFIAPIVQSIKELYAMIMDNSEELEALKAANESLLKKNKELETRLERIEKSLEEKEKEEE